MSNIQDRLAAINGEYIKPAEDKPKEEIKKADKLPQCEFCGMVSENVEERLDPYAEEINKIIEVCDNCYQDRLFEI